MKDTLKLIPIKWKLNGILAIGGLLIGAGLADCIVAIKQPDLNQLARGLTIFSAGLTILVILDNTKTQKKAEDIQKQTELRLEQVEHQLNAVQQAQQLTQKQLQEIKELLLQAQSEKLLEKQSDPAHSQSEKEKEDIK